MALYHPLLSDLRARYSQTESIKYILLEENFIFTFSKAIY